MYKIKYSISVGYCEGFGNWKNTQDKWISDWHLSCSRGARCSSVVRAFAHGVMGRRIDPSLGGPIDLFLVPASAPRLV